MAEMSNLDLLLEAERRGLLSQDKIDALHDARRRGIVPPLPDTAPQSAQARDPMKDFVGDVAGYIGGLDRSIIQGATLGGSDEAEAALNMTPGITGVPAIDALKAMSALGGPSSSSYGENLAAARDKMAMFKAESPYWAFAGEFAGGTATAMNPLTAVAAAPNLLRRIAQGAAIGTGYGATQGFLASGGNEETGVEDSAINRLKSAGVNAAIGGGLGGVLTAAGNGLYKLFGPSADGTNVGIGANMHRMLTGYSKKEHNVADAAKRIQRAADLESQYGGAVTDPAYGPMTEADFMAARAAGQPVINLDRFGELGHDLGRTSTVISPEAAAQLNPLVRGRDAGQVDRLKGFLEAGGDRPNAFAAKQEIADEGAKSLEPLYSKSYQEGAQGIRGMGLEQLQEAPAMQRAMKEAEEKVRNRAALDAANAPVSDVMGELPLEKISSRVPPDEVESIVGMWRHIKETNAQKNPQGLASFVVKSGGVTDPGGDVLSMIGRHKDRPGLVRKSQAEQASLGGIGGAGNENSIDAMALRAWENGFFPNHQQRPTANEFLDALGDDLSMGGVTRAEHAGFAENKAVADQMAQDLEDYGVKASAFRSENSLREFLSGSRPSQASDAVKARIEGPGGKTLEFWDQTKRSLDRRIEDALASNPPNGELAWELGRIRDKLVESLDEAVPSYAKARGKAMNLFQTTDAVAAGEKFASPAANYHNDEVQKALADMTPKQLEGFRTGVLSRMWNRLDELRDNRDAAAEFLNSDATRTRLEMALGSDWSEKFQRFVDVERRMRYGLRTQTTGSHTTPLAERVKEMRTPLGAGPNLEPTFKKTAAGWFERMKTENLDNAARERANEIARRLSSSDPRELFAPAAPISAPVTNALTRFALPQSAVQTPRVDNRPKSEREWRKLRSQQMGR